MKWNTLFSNTGFTCRRPANSPNFPDRKNCYDESYTFFTFYNLAPYTSTFYADKNGHFVEVKTTLSFHFSALSKNTSKPKLKQTRAHLATAHLFTIRVIQKWRHRGRREVGTQISRQKWHKGGGRYMLKPSRQLHVQS